MARNYAGYIEGWEEGKKFLREQRSENAKAWQMFIDEATKNDTPLTAEALDNFRQSITGGDPYFSDALPAQSMMKTIAGNQNQRVVSNILERTTKDFENNQRQLDTGSAFIDIADTPEIAQQKIIKAFGPDAGATWWSKHSGSLETIQTKKLNTRVAELITTPRFTNANDPKDIDALFEKEPAIVRQMLRQSMTDRVETQRKASMQNAFQAIETLNDPTMIYMDDTALKKRVMGIASAHGLVNPTDKEVTQLIDSLKNRRDVTTSAENSRKVKELNNLLTAPDGELKSLLETYRGQAMTPDMMLDIINNASARVGMQRFASIDEARKVLGTDFEQTFTRMRARFDFQQSQAAATAYGQSQAESYYDNFKVNLKTSVNSAVATGSLKKEGPAYLALINLVERGLSTDAPLDDVVKTAAALEKGADNAETVLAGLQRKYQWRTKPELAIKYSSEHMAAKGVAVRPGESISRHVTESADLLNKLIGNLMTKVTNDGPANWNGSAYTKDFAAEIEANKQNIRTIVSNMRVKWTSGEVANFQEYGTQIQFTIKNADGSTRVGSGSVQDYLNQQLAEYDKMVNNIDSQISRIDHSKAAPKSVLPSKADVMSSTALSPAVPDSNPNKTFYDNYQDRSTRQQKAVSALNRAMSSYAGFFGPIDSTFLRKEADVQRLGFKNFDEFEAWTNRMGGVGWLMSSAGTNNSLMAQYLAVHPTEADNLTALANKAKETGDLRPLTDRLRLIEQDIRTGGGVAPGSLPPGGG